MTTLPGSTASVPTPTQPVTVPSRDTLNLGPDATLTPDLLFNIAHSTNTRAAYTTDALRAIEHANQTLDAAHQQGAPIYGLTTGFGPHVVAPAAHDANEQGCALIDHLAAGAGTWTEHPTARAILAARCHTIAQGHSGITAQAANALLNLLNHNITPAIPSLGSVGASGDLIPLAHAAKVITGQGCVLNRDNTTSPALQALATAGLTPVNLTGRDALAIVNGTAFMTAHAALALIHAERLINTAELLSAWLMNALRARTQSLDPRLHHARGHEGQIASAHNIALNLTQTEDTTRALQEVYSIRCAPQFLGACRDQLTHARNLITRELNGVNDNPYITGTPENPAVIHGGNFQGQQIAFAADTINTAITQTALLTERQLDVLCNPELNNNAPLLLAPKPGPTSGLAGAQITATAIAAELRRNNTPSATATMPTNGRNQDVVSMGAMAARVAHEQTQRAANVLAIQTIALTQLNHLRHHNLAPGEPTPSPAALNIPDTLQGFSKDRPLHADISAITQHFLAA